MSDQTKLARNNEFLAAAMANFWRAVRQRSEEESYGHFAMTLSFEAGVVTQVTFDDRLPLKPAKTKRGGVKIENPDALMQKVRDGIKDG